MWSGAETGRTAGPSASVGVVGRGPAVSQLKIRTEKRSVMVSLATVVKARICQQDSATVSREGQLQGRQKESRVQKSGPSLRAETYKTYEYRNLTTILIITFQPFYC